MLHYSHYLLDLYQHLDVNFYSVNLQEKKFEEAAKLSTGIRSIPESSKIDDRVVKKSIGKFLDEDEEFKKNEALILYTAIAEIFSRDKNQTLIYAGEPGFGGDFAMSERESALVDYPLFWLIQNTAREGGNIISHPCRVFGKKKK
ncbi:MAG: hypothetical protein ACRCUT_05705 [Spirochaetota bacterium]